MIVITHKNPNQKLSKYVRKISVFESKRKMKYKQKLTPSAFTYLSYNHKDIPVSIFGNKRVQPTQRLQIAGPKINEDIYVGYNGKLYQILIEFTASGFYYLFHISPSKLLNSLSNLSNLISSEINEQLEQELFESDNGEQQIKLLEEFLFERLDNALPFIDYIEKALQIIDEHNGSINISDLIKEIGISERQFDRKFQEVVGISPKCYSKILQLHFTINLMHSKNYTSIQEIAYQAEFYDLAHFTHRFKELTGFTPNEFIKSDKHIALKYFTDLKK
jgi:AraC-like DNA-binding protein